jgi:drug/metabolite transporter, DME family
MVRSSSSSSLQPTVGYVAIAIAAILWAIAAIVASDLFQSGVAPLALSASRTFVAAAGLGLLYAWKPKSYRWADWRIVALGLSLALVTATYYVAISRMSVAVAIVIQYTAPAMVVGWNALRARTWPHWITMVTALMAMLGIVFVSGVGTEGLRLDMVGLLAAGFSALFFASNTLLNESMVETYGAVGAMFRGFTVSSGFWLAVQIAQGTRPVLFQPEYIGGVLFVGVAGTLIPFSLLCWGIQHVQAERGAIAATLEPVMAALLAWFLLGQLLSFSQILGGLLVIAAITALQFYKPDYLSQG